MKKTVPSATLMAALTATFAAALTACSPRQDTAQAAPVRPLLTLKVSAADALNRAVYSGEVRARHEADLGFRIPGKITARSVDVGSPVRSGQVLAHLDPADARMNADAARAAVAAAATESRFASAEYDRYRSLFEQNFISRAVLEQKSTAFKAATARLEQAESQFAISRNQVGYANLVADRDGVVTAVLAESGQVVAAGQAVVRVARQDEKEVLISIPESRLAATRKARSVAVRLWARPDRIYRGRLRELAPSADPATRTFAARIAILDADADVALGMTANVVIADVTAPNDIPESPVLVPLTALHRQGDQPSVWIVNSETGQVSQRQVVIRQYSEDGALIGGGLAPGETIAVAGVHKLVEGQTVHPVTADVRSATSPHPGPDHGTPAAVAR